MRYMPKFISAAAPLLLILLFPQVRAEASPKTFAFVDSHYVITAEMASEHSFVLNFINLSDFVIVVQPNEFIYRGASGHFYIGQVYEPFQRGVTRAFIGELREHTVRFVEKDVLHGFSGL